MLQQKQRAIPHADGVFECTMSYKNLKLITINYKIKVEFEKRIPCTSLKLQNAYRCTCTQS